MDKTKDIASEFNESISKSSYEFSKNALAKGKLSKAAMMLIAGTTLAGCSSPSIYGVDYGIGTELYSAQEEFVLNSDLIKNINKQAIVDIYNGKSGFFRREDGRVLMLINYDEEKSLTTDEKYAKSKLIIPELENGEFEYSFYHDLKDMAAMSYIHVQKDQVFEYYNKVLPIDESFKASLNGVASLHELCHFLADEDLDEAYISGDQYPEKMVTFSESHADPCAFSLMIYADILDKNGVRELLDKVLQFRKGNAFRGDTEHASAYSLAALGKIIDNNNEFIPLIKNSSIKYISDASITLAKEAMYSNNLKESLNTKVEMQLENEIRTLAVLNDLPGDSFFSNLARYKSSFPVSVKDAVEKVREQFQGVENNDEFSVRDYLNYAIDTHVEMARLDYAYKRIEKINTDRIFNLMKENLNPQEEQIIYGKPMSESVDLSR